MDERSKDMDRVLENQKDTVNARMKENLMDFMSVGEKIGYDEIKKQLADLIEFIGSVEDKKSNY